MSKKIYQPSLYSDDGTNIDFGLPQELCSFDVFESEEECRDWMEEQGYQEGDYNIEEYNEEDIEDYRVIK